MSGRAQGIVRAVRAVEGSNYSGWSGMTKDGLPWDVNPSTLNSYRAGAITFQTVGSASPKIPSPATGLALARERRPNPVIEISNSNCFDGGLNYY